MKWSLLLLVLLPVMLLGQTRRKDVVDSIKAATTLRGVSDLIRNDPGVKVGNIHVTDTGDYVTISVRVRVGDVGVISSVLSHGLKEIESRHVPADPLDALIIPPLPPAVFAAGEISPIAAISVSRLPAEDISEIRVADVIVHSIPEPAMLEFFPLLPVTQLRIADRARRIVKELSVHDLPEPQVTEELSLRGLSQFKIGEIVERRADTTVVTPIAEPVILDDLPLAEFARLEIKLAKVHRLDTVIILSFEEKRMPVGGMHLSDEGYTLLEKLEGFSPELYSLKDGGFTIGFGFFVPYGEGSMWNKGLTWEEAELMIHEKVPTYEDQVKRYINVELTQNEFDALTMLAYNLGGFSKATSIVNDVNTQADFYKLQSDWKRFIHSKAPGVTKGLMNRRRDELEVRNEKDYQPERKIQILKRAR